MDETTCMVWAAENLLHFYRHESCGKCTPCGEGTLSDIDLLDNVANNIAGKTLCPFGDAAAAPALTTVKHFRAEFEAHVREGRCPIKADWRRSVHPRADSTTVGAHQ
jgi:NADH-quinone oxidoreductase subunit F